MRRWSVIIKKPIKTPDVSLYRFLFYRPSFNTSPILCRCFTQELSFTQLQQNSARYATALASVGVRRGDIVPICSEPSIEAIIMFFAINRLGAISTFLNHTAAAEEINGYISDFSAHVLVVSRTIAIREDITHFRAETIIIADSESEIVSVESPEYSLSMLIKQAKTQSVDLDFCGKKAYAHISFTSGSTGAPKKIMLTNENIIAAIISLKKATMLRIGPKLNSLQIVPLMYLYGLIDSVLLHMYCGTTVVLSPGLTLKNISKYIKLYHPCYINGIPCFYTAMIRDPEIQKMDLSFIRFPITGGDTLDAKTEHAINAFLREHGSKGFISNGYGNGEGSGCILNPTAVLRKCVVGSCGLPLPGLSIKLIDDQTGQPVPVGSIGRFCFSGTNLMAGYWQDGHVISDMFVVDEQGMRWFYTDTYMHMDSRQNMFADGRERRFFITFDEHGSPFKVYCDYVQAVIAESHTAIQACAVVQKADSARSYIPICFLHLSDDLSPSEFNSIIHEIKTICKEKLPVYAIPTEFYPIRELPLSIAGKVDYMALENLARNNGHTETSQIGIE